LGEYKEGNDDEYNMRKIVMKPRRCEKRK